MNSPRASTKEAYTLKNVSQGHADVEFEGQHLGFVEFSNSARQWWAYDREGRRIGNWPSHKRDVAARDVWRSFFPNSNEARTR